MKVSVLTGPGEVVLEERDQPAPGPYEVLVEVSSVGVCGSDVHYFRDGRIGPYVVESPLVLGHEASGVVTAVGEQVSRYRGGERVSVEPGVPDFTCEQCLAGRYNLCPNMRFFATPPIDGAFAEYVVIHEAFAHFVPDSVSDDSAALLEPLSVAIWACKKGAVGGGSRVLVNGAGPIGLTCIQVAVALGATEVIVADVNAHRLEVARAVGATTTIDAHETDLREAGLEAEVMLECSGAKEAIEAALWSVARAGHVVLVGTGPDHVAVPLMQLQSRELTITGTFRYANTWPQAISLVASGRVDLDRLVTGHFSLAEAGDALAVGARDETSIKPIVRPAS